MQLLPVPNSHERLRLDDSGAAPVKIVPLHGTVVAMPRCGVYETLRSVTDASAFLHRYLTGNRTRRADYARTEQLLDLAAAAPTHGLRQTATVALRDLLRSENMLG